MQSSRRSGEKADANSHRLRRAPGHGGVGGSSGRGHTAETHGLQRRFPKRSGGNLNSRKAFIADDLRSFVYRSLTEAVGAHLQIM
jgi:hypothetical protein